MTRHVSPIHRKLKVSVSQHPHCQFLLLQCDLLGLCMVLVEESALHNKRKSCNYENIPRYVCDLLWNFRQPMILCPASQTKPTHSTLNQHFEEIYECLHQDPTRKKLRHYLRICECLHEDPARIFIPVIKSEERNQIFKEFSENINPRKFEELPSKFPCRQCHRRASLLEATHPDYRV